MPMKIVNDKDYNYIVVDDNDNVLFNTNENYNSIAEKDYSNSFFIDNDKNIQYTIELFKENNDEIKGIIFLSLFDIDYDDYIFDIIIFNKFI